MPRIGALRRQIADLHQLGKVLIGPKPRGRVAGARVVGPEIRFVPDNPLVDPAGVVANNFRHEAGEVVVRIFDGKTQIAGHCPLTVGWPRSGPRWRELQESGQSYAPPQLGFEHGAWQRTAEPREVVGSRRLDLRPEEDDPLPAGAKLSHRRRVSEAFDNPETPIQGRGRRWWVAEGGRPAELAEVHGQRRPWQRGRSLARLQRHSARS